MSFSLILLAAGDSKRFDSKISKPFTKIGGKTLIELSLIKFHKNKQIKRIIVVIKKGDLKHIKHISSKKVKIVYGGKTRQESTWKALKYIKNQKIFSKNIMIHDAARPNFSINLINKIIFFSKKNTVIPKLNINDAIKEIFDNNLFINVPRDNLVITQTPQSFKFNDIYKLHSESKVLYQDDDLSLMRSLKNVKLINGEKSNFKITDKKDFLLLRNLLETKSFVGIGFDIHRLVAKRKLYLGGLKIKSKLGTLGHSDGDPVLHSITDAILGACKMGDIGQMFSDKSKKFKNIRSTILLKRVINKIKNKGYFVKNLDINIITQTPKIKKYKNKMLDSISKICEISKDQINIKGKTTEKLGLIGKEKAIACEVITSVIKYD